MTTDSKIRDMSQLGHFQTLGRLSSQVRSSLNNGHVATASASPFCADSNGLQRAIAPAKASRGGNAALRAIRLRMYSAIRMPSGADNQMQMRSEAVL